MNTATIRTFIDKIELFQDLCSAELEEVAGAFQTVSFKTDDLIFEENTYRRNLYVIMSGEVELFKHTPLRGERRLSLFTTGDFLGEGALMDSYPHATSARSLSDVKLLAMPRDRFQGLYRTHPDIGIKILSRIARVISRRMRQASTQVVDVAAQYLSGRTRHEHDLLGDREVPYEYYYGIQSLRAVENFSITGISLAHYPELIRGLAMVKQAAARANAELGLLDAGIAEAIDRACQEIVNGKWHTHFVVDMLQGGAGTSTNMNANEVIANRTLELMGHERGEYEFCHPHNHVNMSQSTNDAYPSSLKIALIFANRRLVDVLRELAGAFREKGHEFADIVKMGRTQLQDAVPMTLGQEFEAFAVTLEEEIERLDENARLFLELNLGGTAIGTGINADPRYSKTVMRHLRDITGCQVELSENLVEATQDTGAFVMYSSAIKRLAIKLSKVSSDLRLLSSGPRAGLNEINLPPMQPGSSIMPGKVNPVIPEVVNQIAYKVIGNDLTVTLAAEAGQLQLNVMEPVIVQSLLESIQILHNGIATLRQRCVEGITANEKVCRHMVEGSIGLVTALSPRLGYDVCSRLAREAFETGRGVYELVLEKELLTREELSVLLSPENMIQPRRASSGPDEDA